MGSQEGVQRSQELCVESCRIRVSIVTRIVVPRGAVAPKTCPPLVGSCQATAGVVDDG